MTSQGNIRKIKKEKHAFIDLVWTTVTVLHTTYPITFIYSKCFKITFVIQNCIFLKRPGTYIIYFNMTRKVWKSLIWTTLFKLIFREQVNFCRNTFKESIKLSSYVCFIIHLYHIIQIITCLSQSDSLRHLKEIVFVPLC